MFLYDKTVDALRISLSKGFLDDEAIDGLFPRCMKVDKLPKKLHLRLWEAFLGTELDGTLEVTYRVIEILARIVEYPFKDYGITDIPNLTPLVNYLKRFGRGKRKKALYKLVNGTSGVISKELSKSLQHLGKYISTICSMLITSNMEYLNRIYKHFIVTSPLELYQFCQEYWNS